MAEEMPLQVDNDSKIFEVLYAIKGWAGDGSPKNDVGVLAVGAEAPLKLAGGIAGITDVASLYDA